MTPYYQSERVTLYHGDCLSILPTLEAGSVDAVVTDPPYGIGLRNNDVDGHRSSRSFDVIGDQCQSVGAAALEWAAKHDFPTIAFASPWKPWPGLWRNLIVWDKGGAVGGGGDIKTCLKRTWELVQVARNGPMNGDRCDSVWRVPITPRDTVEHICKKPESLMVRLLERFTQDGSVILDPFTGSGTTGVACIKTGRKFIGIEIDEKYCEIAAKRIQKAEAEAMEQTCVSNTYRTTTGEA